MKNTENAKIENGVKENTSENVAKDRKVENLLITVNLSKIQSLPIIGREWEYRFYVDVTFDDAVRYRQAIEAARPLTSDFRILGEYAECPNPVI